MGCTNSGLVNYTKISPFRTSGRNCIDTITIHCVVGQCSVETLGALFSQSGKNASSNYGIGYDGCVGMYVEEKDRSWCTSSSYNDNRAITIEVASDTTEPLAVRQAAYDKLILLVADICKRNGIKKLVWSTDKNTRVNHLNGCNMTVHRDYANKSCPGTWLYSRMGQIAAAVNAQLSGEPWVEPPAYGPAIAVSVHSQYKGCYGDEVKVVQSILRAMGYKGKDGKELDVDGDFGANSDYAVKQFQKDRGLEADGVWGRDTWAAALTKAA